MRGRLKTVCVHQLAYTSILIEADESNTNSTTQSKKMSFCV